MCFRKVISSLFSILSAGFASAAPLTVGSDAPRISALSQDGKLIDLGKKFKEGFTLVYFYPKADTPGCTKQACNLRDEFDAMTAEGIRVIGVSADNADRQKAFASKYELPFTLIADTNMQVVKAFGVSAIAGKFPARQSFLIHNSKIIWVDLKATPSSQAQDAIAAARAVKES